MLRNWRLLYPQSWLQLHWLRRLNRSHLWRSLALALGAILLVFISHARASETVILEYRDLKLNLTLAQLQAFAADGTQSEDLQAFFQTIAQDPATIQTYLTESIPFQRPSLIPSEFGLILVNEAIGEPLGRENQLDNLRQAIREAIADDHAFSVMELIEQYPESSVRLSLDRLIPIYQDVNLLLTRIEPVLLVAKELLPELVCDCDMATDDRSPTPSPSAAQPSDRRSQTVASSGVSVIPPAPEAVHPLPPLHKLLHSLWADEAIASPKPDPSLSSALLAQSTAPTPDSSTQWPDRELIITFGPFRPSISLADLTRFVDTGYLSPGWRFYFNLAKINPDHFRSALAQPLTIDAQALDRVLNSLLGKYVLYQVGQVVHTRSQVANIQALRSAMVLSALDDGQFSLLELIQKFPNPQLYISGNKLARLGGQVSRLEAAGGVTAVEVSLEDWLVEVQAAVAEQVCTCEQELASPTVIQPLSITADRRAAFLPPNWQPVPFHRDDRGIIKVVWLQGSSYDMGYQHGQLLHEEIASLGSNTLTALRLAGRGLALGHLATFRSYPEIREECQGMAAATEDIGLTAEACMVLAFGDVYQDIFSYTLPRELFWEGCSQFVAVNQASRDGALYHGSTVDNGTPIAYILNNPVVFVRQPNQGLPHVFVSYPGVVWPNSGLNVASITLGLDTAHAAGPNELSLTGTSNVQLMAQILQGATSFEEMVAYMTSQPRVRPNIIMATDGKSKQAGVFEFTGQHFAVRSLQENGVLYATNHFVSEEMVDKQTSPDASSLSRYERYQQLLEPTGRSSYYGQVDPGVATQILRDRVNPKTLQASPLDVFDDNASPGGNGSLRQAIYDPQRLLFWVGAGVPPVPEHPFTCFSLGELLGFPNPTPCPAAQID